MLAQSARTHTHTHTHHPPTHTLPQSCSPSDALSQSSMIMKHLLSASISPLKRDSPPSCAGKHLTHFKSCRSHIINSAFVVCYCQEQKGDNTERLIGSKWGVMWVFFFWRNAAVFECHTEICEEINRIMR